MSNPSFSFSLDSDAYSIDSTGTAIITITQVADNGFEGAVKYTIQNNPPWGAYNVATQPPLPIPWIGFSNDSAPIKVNNPGSVTITGSSTGALTLSSSDAPVGTAYFVINGYSLLTPTYQSPIPVDAASAVLVVT